ncbi:hypothetical protein ACFLWA_04090 [Chloroflexota bacterium]
MSPWLKAGLVGAAVLVVLNLLGLIPCVGLACCILGVFAYAGIGVLAAYWMPPVREASTAAFQGAGAALVAALIGGIVNIVVMTVQMAAVGSGQFLSQIPPEMLDQMYAAGFDPGFFAGPAGGAISGSICCAGGLFLAAIMGAIGGAIYAGIKPE